MLIGVPKEIKVLEARVAQVGAARALADRRVRAVDRRALGARRRPRRAASRGRRR